MTRDEFEKYVAETYGVEPEYPWRTNPDFAVFRHANNKKWFALLMNIPRSRLESGEEIVDAVNLKCMPTFVSSFCADRGIYPAYHMNKAHWISVVIGEADDDEIKMLLDMSFELTMSKVKIKKAIEDESTAARE